MHFIRKLQNVLDSFDMDYSIISFEVMAHIVSYTE